MQNHQKYLKNHQINYVNYFYLELKIVTNIIKLFVIIITRYFQMK